MGADRRPSRKTHHKKTLFTHKKTEYPIEMYVITNTLSSAARYGQLGGPCSGTHAHKTLFIHQRDLVIFKRDMKTQIHHILPRGTIWGGE